MDIRERLTRNAEDFDAIITDVLAENEQLRKDAERYRWMRDNTSVMTFEEQTWVTSHKLDMRIDRAMAETK